jgi:hypothetical protein
LRRGGGPLSGLGDSEDEQIRKAANALKEALDLNPRGGYVKGSAARAALERAIDLLPDSGAGRLGMHLLQGSGPIAELFRHRLHPATQEAMMAILLKKAVASWKEKPAWLREAEREACVVQRRVCSGGRENSAECAAERSANAQTGIRCP